MQQLKNIFLSILSLMAFLIGGAVAGFVVGFSIEFLPSTGMFTSWKLLDSPVKFEKIADINYYGVWAQTTDSKLYLWEFWCYKSPKTCKRWVETENIPSDAQKSSDPRMNNRGPCPKSDKLPKRIPGKVVECALTSFWPGYAYVTLLEDGTIWEWSPPVGTDYPIISLQIGPSIGLGLGLIAGVFFLIFRRRENKLLSTQA